MKGSIFKNPLFYLSVVLFAVLLFQFVRAVRGVGTWQAPPTGCTPPNCLPASPLDTSDVGQEKPGDLNVLGNFIVTGKEGLKVLKDRDKYVQILTQAVPQINFKDDTYIGTLRIHEGVLGFTDINRQGFTPLGSGTGGGGQWQTVTGGIAYNDGKVGVKLPKNTLPLSYLSVGAQGASDAAIWGEINLAGDKDSVGVGGRSEQGIGVYGWGKEYNFWADNKNAKNYFAGKTTLDGDFYVGPDVAFSQDSTYQKRKPFQIGYVTGAKGYNTFLITNSNYPEGFSEGPWFCAAGGASFFDGDIQEDDQGGIMVNMPCTKLRDPRWFAAVDFRSEGGKEERFDGTYTCISRQFVNTGLEHPYCHSVRPGLPADPQSDP